MDKIIAIVRRGGVAAVKLQSGETLRVPSAVYLEHPLHVDQEIDPEAYRAFARQRSYAHALEAATKFLALREHSEAEVRARLRRSCYDGDVIDRVMETLASHTLVDDSRFAEQWAYSRSRKYGKSRIARELRAKGVSDADARQALGEITEEEEYRRALVLAGKLARKLGCDPQKIQQALIRRGYHWSIARRAAEETLHEIQP